jgi:glycosyltransferase involved in cell wall biosynthesis
MTDALKVSAVVCTYNRAALLDRALRTLSAQTFPRDAYEIIVVDNNSTDHTPQVTAAYPRVRYIRETRQGVAYARNRGWQAARGVFVAYVDDECAIPENWLATADEIIQRLAPDVLGGPYFAFYDVPKPSWFKDAYGTHEPFPAARWLKSGEFRQLYGGNLSFRRSLLNEVGGFDLRLGMTGKQLGYGEETDLLERLERRNPPARAYYDPRLRVQHVVRPEKMHLGWIVRARFAGGRATYQMTGNGTNSQGFFRSAQRGVGMLARLCFDLPRGAIRRNRQWYPYYQNYFYEHVAEHFYRLGQVYEQVCTRRNS